MRVQGLVRAVNAVIAAAAILILAGAWWLLWRPAPKTSGEVASGVKSQVTVARDGRAVPHVRATSPDDLYYAQGFVTAQDRMWQMDMLRRLAGGELSEVIGAGALEFDTIARKMRLPRLAEEYAQRLGPEERKALTAYARGVNHYIELNRNNLPPEFRAMGYEPRTWRIADSILCALQLGRTLTFFWKGELLKRRMLANGDAAKIDRLFPVRSGREVMPGSNAWVISGKHTVSGKPILANDPHLEYTMPATWYEVHLTSPDTNVIGVSLPGLPGVIIGHNESIAWGVTNLGFDVLDLYVEKINLATGKYEHKGEVLQARAEQERIAIKGSKPAQLINWITVHGPIFTSDGNAHLAMRWTGAEGFRYPVPQLNRAKDWNEFRAAIQQFPWPGQNWVYADTSGNIGYQANGILPIRKGFAGDVPIDGASGDFEWQGFIPFEEMPRVYNPPSGRFVTANQNPFPADSKYVVDGSFSSHYRQRQIDARLKGREKWKPSEMIKLQTDVYSPYLHFLANQGVRASEKTGKAREAAQLLRQWNGQMQAGLAAPLLADLLHRQIRRRLAECAAPKVGAEYKEEMSSWVVEDILSSRPAGWFDDWDGMLSSALQDAYDEAGRQYGKNTAKWDYGRLTELTVTHPVASRIAWLAPYFNAGPARTGGSSTTVKQRSGNLGPSMRFVADLSNWDNSQLVITTGQSGHLLTGHYKDQWPAYLSGAGLPLEFTKVDGKATLILQPR